MLQDIAPKRLRNEYRPDAKVAGSDYVISIVGQEVLCSIDSIGSPVSEQDGDDSRKQLDFPRYEDVYEGTLASDFIYIFTIDDEQYFLYRGEKLTAIKSEDDEAGYMYRPFSEIRGHIVGPRYQQYALYTAKHLNDWYGDNQFCGRCGKPMHHSDTERCMVCDCGYHSYPRIMPAVIVGVRNGDKLLLTKYRTGYNHNALIAGFVEIGETIEECVAREVMEEAGVKVKNITYYKSQPWGIANDILVGYYCDVDGDDTITMDGNELKYADWVKRDDIELQPDDISLTNEMMKMFKLEKDR